MGVENNYACVTTQRILNKFIKINFSVGCIVWPSLFQQRLPIEMHIDKMTAGQKGLIFHTSYQNYQPSRRKLGTVLENKVPTNYDLKKDVDCT